MNQQLPVDLTTIPYGTVVFDSEGELLGTVESTTEALLTLTNRLNKPTLYYIPVSEVDSWDGVQVCLKATAEFLWFSGWDEGQSEPTQPP